MRGHSEVNVHAPYIDGTNKAGSKRGESEQPQQESVIVGVTDDVINVRIRQDGSRYNAAECEPCEQYQIRQRGSVTVW